MSRWRCLGPYRRRGVSVMILSKVHRHSYLINRSERIEAQSLSALAYAPLPSLNTREMRSIDVAIMNFPPSSFRNSLSRIGWEIQSQRRGGGLLRLSFQAARYKLEAFSRGAWWLELCAKCASSSCLFVIPTVQCGYRCVTHVLCRMHACDLGEYHVFSTSTEVKRQQLQLQT